MTNHLAKFPDVYLSLVSLLNMLWWLVLSRFTSGLESSGWQLPMTLGLKAGYNTVFEG